MNTVFNTVRFADQWTDIMAYQPDARTRTERLWEKIYMASLASITTTGLIWPLLKEAVPGSRAYELVQNIEIIDRTILFISGKVLPQNQHRNEINDSNLLSTAVLGVSLLLPQYTTLRFVLSLAEMTHRIYCIYQKRDRLLP